MSVIKRVAPSGSVTWLARVFRDEDPLTGKQTVVVKSFRTQKEAKAWELATRKQVGEGVYQEPVKVTLAEFFAEWLEKSARIRLKVQTVELYERVFRLYIEPHIGKLLLQNVTPLAIQGAYALLTSGPKKVSPQTVKNAHTALRSCLKQAVRWRYLTFNPSVDVDLPKRMGQTAKVRSFTPEQAVVFLNTCRKKRLGWALHFALASGARPGEYLALLWSDIDWEAGTVRIEKSIVWPKGGGWHFDSPKTRKSGRTISLPVEVLDELREHRIRQLEHKQFLGKDWKSEHDLVFTDTTGNAVYERHLTTRTFKVILKEAGLPSNFRLYDLRHTWYQLVKRHLLIRYLHKPGLHPHLILRGTKDQSCGKGGQAAARQAAPYTFVSTGAVHAFHSQTSGGKGGQAAAREAAPCTYVWTGAVHAFHGQPGNREQSPDLFGCFLSWWRSGRPGFPGLHLVS